MSQAKRVMPGLAGTDTDRVAPDGEVISSVAVPAAPAPSAKVINGVFTTRARSRPWKSTGATDGGFWPKYVCSPSCPPRLWSTHSVAGRCTNR
jgi:hypothetical protein